ncbi:MAG: DJ-1/PfpI family protein [Magnetococcales bacterium]|nr:DJ-1/PfpI family protein [Magnetococcales bacterium]
MKRVLIPIAQGCEELEAVTLIDLLRRAGVEVVTAGLGVAGPVTCSRGTVLVPDTTLEAVRDEAFDMVVLPGGLPGTTHLDEDPRIRTLLQRMDREEKMVAAICAAPMVLANAGLLAGKKATSYPECIPEAHLSTLEYREEAVVRDGRVITSRGPGTAMDFALALIEVLTTPAIRQQVAADLLYP